MYRFDLSTLERLNISQLNALTRSRIRERSNIVFKGAGATFEVPQNLYRNIENVIKKYNRLANRYGSFGTEIGDIFATSVSGLESFLQTYRERATIGWFERKNAVAIENFKKTLYLAPPAVEAAIRAKLEEMPEKWILNKLAEGDKGAFNIFPDSIYDSQQGLQYDNPKNILKLFEIPYEEVYPADEDFFVDD